MNPRFAGEVALVTGAAAGIGREVALALGAEGAAVAAFDRDREGLAAVVAEVEGGPGRAIAIGGDAGDGESVAVAVATAIGELGDLSLLANVAGILRSGDVVETDEETWDLVLATNLKSQYLFAKHAIPAMRRRGGGAIVNVTSILAFATLGASAAYSASKGGIVALTAAMAVDHAGDGIRVNCVAPGSVRTEMLRTAVAQHFPADPDAALERIAALEPLGRLVEPEDVARLVVFLLSEEAGAISGGCHRVDGALLSRLGAVAPLD